MTHRLAHRDRHHPTASLQLARHLSRSVCEWGRHGCLNELLSEQTNTPPQSRPTASHSHCTTSVSSRHVTSLVTRTTSPRVPGCHTLSRPLRRERAHPTHPGCSHDLRRCTPGRLTHHLLTLVRGALPRAPHMEPPPPPGARNALPSPSKVHPELHRSTPEQTKYLLLISRTS